MLQLMGTKPSTGAPPLDPAGGLNPYWVSTYEPRWGLAYTSKTVCMAFNPLMSFKILSNNFPALTVDNKELKFVKIQIFRYCNY